MCACVCIRPRVCVRVCACMRSCMHVCVYMRSVSICIHVFGFLPLTFTFSTVSILKTFLLLHFKCYKDHECSYTYVHTSMVGRVMLCGVGSMFLVDSSLVQVFVSSNFSNFGVLTMYVYSCHTSLTVMPLSVHV